ncbi:hypothetical protein [Halorubrum sodomense]|uniref:Uncharacterized protein n=1 Tax=Halorubrum sodomense TaxID=35743 RepID=A0A1I6FML0_HALSD|nr:hypothetical protein [Halorubrum sodomense]SFR31171.1 hypothetical protein SAMN04487937_1012 [Halorubrum sodomense]
MSSSGDGLLAFINGDTSGGIPIVNVANPVDWGRLGQTIGTSILATVVVGVTNIVDAITDAIDRIFGGLAAFIAGSYQPTNSTGIGFEYARGLLDVTIGAVGGAYTSAFQFSSAQFGILALPVNVGIVLGSVYVLSVGGQKIASRATGGG